MKRWVRNSLYVGVPLFCLSVGAVGGAIGGFFGRELADHYLGNRFDFNEYGESSPLVLGVEVNKGTRDVPDWQPYRRIGVEHLDLEDQSATGMDDEGRHLRARVEKYDPFGFAIDSVASSNAP